MSLRTEYEFVLPRGYVDDHGALHRVGTMRLATARDELEPLRDPTVQGPDDPRLTVLVLARVVTRLGDLELVTPHEIEGLFAADLAFLQDFYGVINFGNQEEYESLLRAQQETPPPPTPVAPGAASAAPGAGRPTEPVVVASATFSAPDERDAGATGDGTGTDGDAGRPASRGRIEEIRSGGR